MSKFILIYDTFSLLVMSVYLLVNSELLLLYYVKSDYKFKFEFVFFIDLSDSLIRKTSSSKSRLRWTLTTLIVRLHLHIWEKVSESFNYVYTDSDHIFGVCIERVPLLSRLQWSDAAKLCANINAINVCFMLNVNVNNITRDVRLKKCVRCDELSLRSLILTFISEYL